MLLNIILKNSLPLRNFLMLLRADYIIPLFFSHDFFVEKHHERSLLQQEGGWS